MKKNIALYFLCVAFLFIGFGCSKEREETLAGTRWEDNYIKEYGIFEVLEFVSETKVVHYEYYTSSSTGVTRTYETEYSYVYKHPEVVMYPTTPDGRDLKGLISGYTMAVFEPSTGRTVGAFINK